VRRWTNCAVQLSTVVCSYRLNILGVAGNCLFLFRSMRGTVTSRNGEGIRRPGRLYVSDHFAYIGLSHCGKKMCVAVRIVCCTLHFLCNESCLRSTDKWM
jgi:hypothetical protein